MLFQDPRFNSEIDMKMGYKTQSILSMPIKDSEGEVIGVAQAVNKVVNRNLAFNEHDEKVKAPPIYMYMSLRYSIIVHVVFKFRQKQLKKANRRR